MNKYTFLCIIMHAAGIGVGYLIGKKVTKRKYEERFNKELNHIKEYYEGAHPEKPKMNDFVHGPAEIHTMNEEYVKPNNVDYHSYYVSLAEGVVKPAEDKSQPKKPIKIIKDEDFGSEPLFKTVNLLYYTENDTLTVCEDDDADKEDVIYFGEVEDMIGDALTKFGFKSNDQRRICVRNYRNSCDFRITKIFDAFTGD